MLQRVGSVCGSRQGLLALATAQPMALALQDWPACRQRLNGNRSALSPSSVGVMRPQNLWAALRVRLRGTGCEPLGPDAGLATVGDAVRYPDALVTCTRVPGTHRLVPGVIVVFEVVSPTSGRTDRIDKLREYRSVPSIRRYVILEHTSIGLTVLERPQGNGDWTATALTAADTLHMPEIGIEIPVAELYEGTDPTGNDNPDRTTDEVATTE